MSPGSSFSPLIKRTEEKSSFFFLNKESHKVKRLQQTKQENYCVIYLVCNLSWGVDDGTERRGPGQNVHSVVRIYVFYTKKNFLQCQLNRIY